MERKGYTTLTKEIKNLSINEVWIYSIIKSFRKKDGYSDLTYKQIAEYSGISIKTVEKVIPKLIKNKSLFSKVEKKDLGDGMTQNQYYFNDGDNWFKVDNKYFSDCSNYKEKAFVLILKSICLNDTNNWEWSNSELAKHIKLSRPTIIKYMESAKQCNLINNKEIIDSNVIDKVKKNINDFNYNVIKKFCELKGVEAPQKDEKLLGYISAQCSSTEEMRTDDYLPYVLVTRCKTLPEHTNLAYFVKVVRNINYNNPITNNYNITL